MSLYETVFIARQDISSAQVEALAESFAAIVTEQGGAVAKTEHWGLRNLAFRIRKNNKGHYVLFNLDAPPAAVLEMERNMGLHEDVLRFLSVRVDALEEGPSAMMLNRGDRPERGRRDRDGRPGDEERERFPREERERHPRQPHDHGDGARMPEARIETPSVEQAEAGGPR